MTEKELFRERLLRHCDELKWLYCKLYGNRTDMLEELCGIIRKRAAEREETLKRLDAKREADPDWYKRNDMAGMMMYTEAFAKTLRGVKEKLDYIEECGVNYLHLMPLLE